MSKLRRQSPPLPALGLLLLLPGFALIAPGIAAVPAQSITDEELIRTALENSSRISIAQLAVENGAVTVRQARARRAPQVSGSLDFSYLSNPLDPVIIRTGEFGIYDLGGLTTAVPPTDVRVYDGMEPTLFQLGVVLEQPLYTWGKLDLGVRLADDLLRLRQAEVRRAEQDLTVDVAVAAVTVRHLLLMRQIANRQIELTAELVGLVRSAFETGAVVRTDVLEAQVAARQAALARTELTNQIEVNLVTLRQLTGLTDLRAEDLAPLAGASGPPPELRPVDDLVRDALSGNPSIMALERARVAAETQRVLASATARTRPDFGLRLDLSLTGPRVPLETDWYGKDEFNLVASIGLQSTLYDGGLRRDDATLAEIDEATVAEQIVEAEASLAAEVRKLAFTAELSIARIAYLEANAGLLAERLAVREREFDAGVGGRDSVVRAELAVLANELETTGEFIVLRASLATLEVLSGAPGSR